MIKIYPSKLDGDPVEQHKIRKTQSIKSLIEYLSNTTIDLLQDQPVSVSVDGKIIPVSGWADFNIQLDDDVHIVFEAKGGVVKSIGNVLSSVVNSVFKIFVRTPSTGKIGDAAKRIDSDDIDTATIKANQAKLNDPIPERFGMNRVYPDYVVPNHSYFVGNEQYTEMLLSVGYGSYSINSGQIHIGETPLVSLGTDAESNIYMPGADLSDNSAHQFWHTADEVGGTSTGNSGLELGITFNVPATANASAYVFAGQSVTVPAGAGSFPKWQAGMYVHIERYTPVTFSKVDGQSAFEGNVNNIPWKTGDIVEIVSTDGDGNDGTVYIDQVIPGDDDQPKRMTLKTSDGTPITFLKDGTFDVSIGYAGHRYLITGAQDSDTPSWISVSMLDDHNTEVDSWLGFDQRLTVDASLVLDRSTVTGGWTGPFMACPENETTNQLEWDIFFPQGLVTFDEKKANTTYARAFTYELQYRDASTLGDWTSIKNTINAQSIDQYAVTHKASLPYAMRPEVRIRRIGAKSDSTYIQDGGEWYALRSRLDVPFRYSDITTLAVKVKTGTRISAQTDNQIWCYATRMLPPFSVPEAGIRATRSIADAMTYMARRLGYRTDQIDIEKLKEYHRTWEGREDTFNHSFTSLTTLKEAVNNALGCGYAELIVDRGLLVPVRDEKRTMFDHVYTPQNMTSTLAMAVALKSIDSNNDYDGVDVEYLELKSGNKETVPCRLPGDMGTKVQKITVYGINDRTRAWRYGMRQRRILKYRRKEYSFSTGFDSLNSSYLDYCTVTDDIERFGQSAEVVSFFQDNDRMIIEVNQPFEWTDNKEHVVVLRKPDGTASGPYVAIQTDNQYEINIPVPDFTPIGEYEDIDPTHIAFGMVNRAFYAVLIQSVKPSGSPVGDKEPDVYVTAVNYDDRVYLDDDEEPIY